METKFSWTHVTNAYNGQPRYVVHFLPLRKFDGETYEQVCKRMNKYGGRKFHNKQYGGGIVFVGLPHEIERRLGVQ